MKIEKLRHYALFLTTRILVFVSWGPFSFFDALWALKFSVDVTVIGAVARIVNGFLCPGMSWKSHFSAHLTSYPAQFRPAFTIRRKKRRDVAVVQTSPSTDIFLPIRHRELTAGLSHHSSTPRTFPIHPQYSGYRMRLSRKSFLISLFFHE